MKSIKKALLISATCLLILPHLINAGIEDELALKAKDENNEALEVLHEMARDGNHAAQFQFATVIIYRSFETDLFSQNIEEVYNYLLLLSEENNHKAQKLLGFLYDHCTLYLSRENALKYYRLAAKNGNADAQFSIFYKGSPIFIPEARTVSLEEAIFNLKLAARQNHPDAIIELARFMKSGLKDGDSILVEQDVKAAYRILKEHTLAFFIKESGNPDITDIDFFRDNLFFVDGGFFSSQWRLDDCLFCLRSRAEALR